MKLGVLKESDDHRVALVPATAKKIKALGVEIFVEKGAGKMASIVDADYTEFASLLPREELLKTADMLISIHTPTEETLKQIPQGRHLIALFQPFADDSIVERLRKAGLEAFSMDMIPRTTLAQSMDVLSSMASIAGYKAVLTAANHLPRYFPMMITAAGSVRPAKVLVLGAGVAGLQAIATARRLGAMVEAFDVRKAAKEEVESLGAKFVEIEGARDDADAGGYAVEQSEDFLRRQREEVQNRAMKADVIITTAQVRGRKAPILVPATTVEQMKQGAVIVDLAASTGGNCELSQNAKTIVHKGVTIIGDSALASGMPQDASLLYSNNLFNFLQLLLKDGELSIDLENEIVRSAYITAPQTSEA
ncbi:MAG: Re/Si-specific NAD(P)(+) transhydrogenase subunit alpha [Bacteroidota bacterium]